MPLSLPDTYAFDLPEHLVATEPRREATRLLLARRSTGELRDGVAADLPALLEPGDLLVVNTSATEAAALPAAGGLVVHLSGPAPDDPGAWVVEVRRRCGSAGSAALLDAEVGRRVELDGGGDVVLRAPVAEGPSGTRLWRADVTLAPTTARRPIRYGCVDTAPPLAAYQTVFARPDAGGFQSAEAPSAALPFTLELVAALVTRGVALAPVALHCGVSSQEAGEAPQAERYAVPAATAERIAATKAAGHRVVAVGTTVTRAVETTGGRAGRGWTEHVVTPDSPPVVVDGLLTGWHEPRASHLALLEAVAGRELLEASYAAALAEGHLWHEFGDWHLVLP